MITILFSCETCGIEDAECQVRARSAQENPADWIEDVVAKAVSNRHLHLSLLCDSKSFQNLKIPIDKDDPDGWIGKQTDIVPQKGKV